MPVFATQWSEIFSISSLLFKSSPANNLLYPSRSFLQSTGVPPYPQGACFRPLVDVGNTTGITELSFCCGFCFFSCTHTSSHLKQAFYGFSLAFPICQHHCPCALGLLLSKRKVIWKQALWYLNSWSDNLHSHSVTDRQGANTVWMCRTKRWFTSGAGWS